jgi:Spy/CpxP family protein refolding chaperone
MRMLCKSVVALGLAAVLATPAMAQQRRGPGGFGGFGRGAGLSMLLSNASVQEELKLDDSQKEKVKEFADKAREKMTAAREELQNLSQEERGKKFRELTAEANAAARKTASEVLKPEQHKRLEQIELQVGGANAFESEHLQKKLSITDEQKSAIASIIEASNKEAGEIFQSSQSDRQAAMEKIRELRKKTLEDVKGKLTDDQKSKYTELLGSPFEIKFEGGTGRRGN